MKIRSKEGRCGVLGAYWEVNGGALNAFWERLGSALGTGQVLGLGQWQRLRHGQAQAHGQGQVHMASEQDGPLTPSRKARWRILKYINMSVCWGLEGGLCVSDLGSFESLTYVSLGQSASKLAHLQFGPRNKKKTPQTRQ